MKYIKNYSNDGDFEDAGNVPPKVWHCVKENYPGGSFHYWVEMQQTSRTVDMVYRGKVNESVPGVAYMKTSELGSGHTCYNNDFGLPEISAATNARNTTWQEFGITQELYDRYLSLAKDCIYPPEFNITVGNLNCMDVYYVKASGTTDYDYIDFSFGSYSFVVRSNGVVVIKSNIA